MRTKGHPGKCLTEVIPRDVLREKNPSGNRQGMKQEFAALFKAFRRRGYSGERRLKERRMKLLYRRGIKGIIRAFKKRLEKNKKDAKRCKAVKLMAAKILGSIFKSA